MNSEFDFLPNRLKWLYSFLKSLLPCNSEKIDACVPGELLITFLKTMKSFRKYLKSEFCCSTSIVGSRGNPSKLTTNIFFVLEAEKILLLKELSSPINE